MLKAGDGGELAVPGSVGLAHAPMRHYPVDVHVLWVYPVAPGQGRRLLLTGIDRPPRLVGCRTCDSGFRRRPTSPEEILPSADPNLAAEKDAAHGSR